MPAAAPRRVTQYFEMLGNRAIYHDGWVACTTPPIAPWDPNSADVDPITGYRWELYDINNDFTQAENLVESAPEKLKDLQIRFYAEAAKYNVLPIDNGRTGRLDPANRPSLSRGRKSFTFFEGMTRIPEGAAPDIKNKSFAITAVIELAAGDPSGMILTQGGLSGDTASMLKRESRSFHYNLFDVAHYEVAGTEALSAGSTLCESSLRLTAEASARGATRRSRLTAMPSAQGRIERTIPIRVTLDEGLDVGEDTGTPLNLSYDVPFKFPGRIEKVTIDLK